MPGTRNALSREDYGKTPLGIASERGHLHVVCGLLLRRADVDGRQAGGQTALMLAGGRGHALVVQYLLGAGANVHATDDSQKNSLGAACAGRSCSADGYPPSDTSAAQLLLAAGAQVTCDVSDDNALLSACEGGDAILADHLLKTGADVNTRDGHHATLLMNAADRGHFSVVEVLLRHRADAAKTDDEGATALVFAVCNSAEAPRAHRGLKRTHACMLAGGTVRPRLRTASSAPWAVSRLLESGCGANRADGDGWTPLMYASAVTQPSAAVASLLLDAGANVHATNTGGGSALMHASLAGSCGVVSLLLERGASLEARSDAGLTPLALASLAGCEGVGSLLLERGADPDVTGEDGWSPLMHACRQSCVRLALRLIEASADVYKANEAGTTALHIAARCCPDAVVLRLLQVGAEADSMDSTGKTAIDYAHSARVAAVIDEHHASLAAAYPYNAFPKFTSQSCYTRSKIGTNYQ
ncbi:hypothetical protein DIPPA_16404 [Diplonema papillatum]|nr:hypothetical protein DIPPA_16404 [Diplonema papillatum]|eukprot:gene5789-8854_t